MKEDILEQLVSDWLEVQGVANCKSWQGGLRLPKDLDDIVQNRRVGGKKEARKRFRELTTPKWARALRQIVKDMTGEESFVHYTAVTVLKGDRVIWETHQEFQEVLENPVRIVALKEMVADVTSKLTKTIANTHFSRALQLLKAAGLLPPGQKRSDFPRT